MKQRQHQQKLQPTFELVGLVIAGAVWVPLIIWLIDIAGLERGVSAEDVLGPQAPWVIMLIVIPFAILFALSGEAIGKAIQRLFGKVG